MLRVISTGNSKWTKVVIPYTRLQTVSSFQKQSASMDFLSNKVLPREDAIIKLREYIEKEFGGWDENAIISAIQSSLEPSNLEPISANSNLPIKTSGIVNFLLDILGFVPGAGEVADVTNAISYAVQGKYLFAGLSLISVIPGVGDIIGKGSKALIWTLDSFDGGEEDNQQVAEMKEQLKRQRASINELLVKSKNDKELAPFANKIESELNEFIDSEQLSSTDNIQTSEENSGWTAAWKHKGKILAGLIAAAGGMSALYVAKYPKEALQSLKGVLSTAFDYLKSGGEYVVRWILSQSKWGQSLLDTIDWFGDKEKKLETIRAIPGAINKAWENHYNKTPEEVHERQRILMQNLN